MESFEEDKDSKTGKRIFEEVNFQNFDCLSVLGDHEDAHELPENLLIGEMSDLDILVAAAECAPASILSRL